MVIFALLSLSGYKKKKKLSDILQYKIALHNKINTIWAHYNNTNNGKLFHCNEYDLKMVKIFTYWS